MFLSLRHYNEEQRRRKRLLQGAAKRIAQRHLGASFNKWYELVEEKHVLQVGRCNRL